MFPRAAITNNDKVDCDRNSFVTVLDIRSLNSTCLQSQVLGWTFPLKSSEENLSLPLSALAHACVTPISNSVFTRAPLLHLSSLLSLMKILDIGVGPTQVMHDGTLTQLPLQRLFGQIKSHS